MKKKIIFIRHGQSEHNVSGWEMEKKGIFLWDAKLSAYGIEQAAAIKKLFRNHTEIELIVASPLTRALATTLLAFQDHPAPRFVLPDAREIQTGGDDLGSDSADLAVAFPQFDFSHLPKGPWFHTSGATTIAEARDLYAKTLFKEPERLFVPRLNALKQWLWNRREHCIAVVCHADLVLTLTGITLHNCEIGYFWFDGERFDLHNRIDLFDRRNIKIEELKRPKL